MKVRLLFLIVVCMLSCSALSQEQEVTPEIVAKSKEYVQRIKFFKNKEMKKEEYVVLAKALIVFAKKEKTQKEIDEQLHQLVLLNNYDIITFILKFTNPFTLSLAFEEVFDKLDIYYLQTLFRLLIDVGYYEMDGVRYRLTKLQNKRGKRYVKKVPVKVQSDFELTDYDKKIFQNTIIKIQKMIIKIIQVNAKLITDYMPEELKKWSLDVVTEANANIPGDKIVSQRPFYVKLYNQILSIKTDLYKVTY